MNTIKTVNQPSLDVSSPFVAFFQGVRGTEIEVFDDLDGAQSWVCGEKNGGVVHIDNAKVSFAKEDTGNTGNTGNTDGATVRADVTLNMSEVKVSFTFFIQLVDGRYSTEQGCLLTTLNHNSYEDFNHYEKVVLAAIEEELVASAEKYAQLLIKERYELLDAGFNCLLDGAGLYFRIDKESDDEVGLIMLDMTTDFGEGEALALFDTLAAAKEYVDTFRTGEYQDCKGLYAITQGVNNE